MFRTPIKYYLILAVLSSNVGAVAPSISAFDVVEEQANLINKTRLSAAPPNKRSIQAIENIKDILSGRKYGIEINKRASDEERQKANYAVLNMHLHNRTMGVSLTEFKNPLQTTERYFGHLTALACMHLSAHFVTHSKQVYYLADHEFYTELVHKMDHFIRTENIADNFRNYLRKLKLQSDYFQAVLGIGYREMVFKLTIKYPDVPQNWIPEFFEKHYTASNIKMVGLPEKDQILHDRDTVPSVLLAFDPDDIFTDVISNFDIHQEDYCRLAHYTIVRAPHKIKTLEQEFIKAKRNPKFSQGKNWSADFVLKNRKTITHTPDEIIIWGKSYGSFFKAYGSVYGLPLKNTSLQLTVNMDIQKFKQALIDAGILLQ
jgi:hypothetical protein